MNNQILEAVFYLTSLSIIIGSVLWYFTRGFFAPYYESLHAALILQRSSDESSAVTERSLRAGLTTTTWSSKSILPNLSSFVMSPTRPNSPQMDQKTRSLDFSASAPARSSPCFPRPSLSGIRQRTLSGTFTAINDFEEFEGQKGWQPGAEPGIDPSKPNGGQSTAPSLQAECHITVVDFSRDDLEVHRLRNSQLHDFLKLPKPSWVACRWINVNGLSWDVIQTLGSYKNLDPLNIEDTMTTSNPPKVDWRHDQAFITLTCQKLVRLIEDDTNKEDENDDTWSVKSFGSVSSTVKKFRRLFPKKETNHPTISMLEKGIRPSPQCQGLSRKPTGFSNTFNPSTLCSLQGYRASRNTLRTEYMMEHSALAPKGLAVMVEQVSMFMTMDNTIISFFEQSANDVEQPILTRLGNPSSVLRRSCAASMVMQAIIDAIMDMAMPVAACYADVLGDLELDVLRKPKVKDTQKLYIIITEINKMFSLVNPIQTLVKTLRDRAKLSQKIAAKEATSALEGITISSTTCPYLGDVYDHCVLVTGDLAGLKQSAENMVQLIFNTVLTKQSGSMKTLAVISAAFLPAMFMTSYFGQNFTEFPAIHDYGVQYFWYLAVPVVILTLIFVMHEALYECLKDLFQRDRKGTEKKVVFVKIQKTA